MAVAVVKMDNITVYQTNKLQGRSTGGQINKCRLKFI
jgi:hypothetical protein